MDARIFIRPRGLAAVSPERRREIGRKGGLTQRRLARLSPEERHALAAKAGAAARAAWGRLSADERRQRIAKAVAGQQRRVRPARVEPPAPPSFAWRGGVTTTVLADGLVRVVSFDLVKMVRFPGERWRLVG